jgi:2-dehydropantoate 2-reductase
LILFTVKGFDNRDAIELIRPAVASDTIILTLQNGIGSGDELRRSFSLSKVLLGVTYIDAHKPSPGIVVESGDDSGIVLGETEDSNPDAVMSVHKVFNSAQINARVSKMIQVEVWNKLMFICALSGMSSIVRAGFENVLDNPETRDLTIRVMREVESLAMAKGIILDSNVVQSTMDRLDDNKSTLTSSMYTDLENGNRLEIEVLNGAVSKYASEIGLKTPVNDFITACLMVPHRAAIKRANRS